MSHTQDAQVAVGRARLPLRSIGMELPPAGGNLPVTPGSAGAHPAMTVRGQRARPFQQEVINSLVHGHLGA